jgi:phytoene/squalene synthetase
MQDYDQICFKICKNITDSYSTSFSWGIKAFAAEYRNAIYSIYAYVRLADEIVDTFHDYDKKTLLREFRIQTYDALDKGISTNPVINAFHKTAMEYNIGLGLINSFLDSMEQDLFNSSYKRAEYDNYIYGSAEVVGLMCLKVFVKGNEKNYNRLLQPAKMLGSAFQKVNFLRDIKSDLDERGRIYLPDVNNELLINDYNKKLLEIEIEKEFQEALVGIKKLPIGVRLGVYSAYMYYFRLFKKIKKLKVKDLLNKRVRISNFRKLLLLTKTIINVNVAKLIFE